MSVGPEGNFLNNMIIKLFLANVGGDIRRETIQVLTDRQQISLTTLENVSDRLVKGHGLLRFAALNIKPVEAGLFLCLFCLILLTAL